MFSLHRRRAALLSAYEEGDRDMITVAARVHGITSAMS